MGKLPSESASSNSMLSVPNENITINGAPAGCEKLTKRLIETSVECINYSNSDFLQPVNVNYDQNGLDRMSGIRLAVMLRPIFQTSWMQSTDF